MFCLQQILCQFPFQKVPICFNALCFSISLLFSYLFFFHEVGFVSFFFLFFVYNFCDVNGSFEGCGTRCCCLGWKTTSIVLWLRLNSFHWVITGMWLQVGMMGWFLELQLRNDFIFDIVKKKKKPCLPNIQSICIPKTQLNWLVSALSAS